MPGNEEVVWENTRVISMLENLVCMCAPVSVYVCVLLRIFACANKDTNCDWLVAEMI